MMAEAVPASSAFEQAFGRTWEQAGQALVGYVRNARFPVVEIDWDEGHAATSAGVTTLSAVETDLAKAELFMAIGNQAESERYYQRVAAARTESAEVETALGALALSRNDRAEARKRLERAIQLGTREARTYFEYAMLLRESGAPKKDVIAHLDRTVELNPQYAEAHFLLGEEELRRSRFDGAIGHLRQATAILPRQSYFWHALALAYHGQGERELARRAAHRASDSAKTEAESAAAQAVIRLFDKAPQTTPARKPDVTTPQSWQNRKGDALAEGKLAQIECRGSAARFHVITAKGKVVLEALRPHEIPLRNAGAVKREFSCGPQRSVAVAIEYLAETREIVAIEFR
jgi:tetratricopeptide (TPR) repeat protein